MKIYEQSLYLIGAISRAYKVKAVKIGYAKDTGQRLTDLQVGNHMLLELVAWFPVETTGYAKRLERQIHWRFRGQHVRGEWFAGGKNVCRYIRYIEHDLGLVAGRIDPV